MLHGRITILTSTLIIMAAMLSVLLLATWYAGRQSIRLDTQPVSADLDRLAQQVATTGSVCRKRSKNGSKRENK